jgi:hypothetical protein
MLLLFGVSAMHMNFLDHHTGGRGKIGLALKVRATTSPTQGVSDIVILKTKPARYQCLLVELEVPFIRARGAVVETKQKSRTTQQILRGQ